MLMSNGKDSIIVIDNNSVQELQYKNIYIYMCVYVCGKLFNKCILSRRMFKQIV
jgi:hypothetical protein